MLRYLNCFMLPVLQSIMKLFELSLQHRPYHLTVWLAIMCIDCLLSSTPTAMIMQLTNPSTQSGGTVPSAPCVSNSFTLAVRFPVLLGVGPLRVLGVGAGLVCLLVSPWGLACCGWVGAVAPYLHLLCRLLVLGGADVVLGVGSGATGEWLGAGGCCQLGFVGLWKTLNN